MALFAHFEDAFFEEPAGKTADNTIASRGAGSPATEAAAAYSPKICSSLWFNGAPNAGGAAEETTSQTKFRADYLYAIGEYAGAMQAYEELLPRLEKTNVTFMRDCTEGVIRCWAHLGQTDRALLLAQKFVADSETTSQTISALLLLHPIYHKQRLYSDEIELLEKLVSDHPLSADLWCCLGIAYACFGKIPLRCIQRQPESLSQRGSPSPTLEHKLSACALGDETVIPENGSRDVAAAMGALIRTRMLLETSENGPHFINYEQSRELLRQIDVELQSMDLPRDDVASAKRVLPRDAPRQNTEIGPRTSS